ncbi:hypothetical protein G9A89_003163 [Geosiphon pyriformis]|nr:hypothetical protein G9A89_003163 [Geosiphon pyriformis]
MTTTSKVVTQTDLRTLEYYQSIYTHCKQKFNISDGIETFKKTLYQYIENCINNYLFGDYNISETESEQETEDSENEEEMTSTYIAKIPEFTEEDSETSPQKWLDKVSKVGDANG